MLKKLYGRILLGKQALSATEYALIAGAVILVIMGAFRALGVSISGAIEGVAGAI